MKVKKGSHLYEMLLENGYSEGMLVLALQESQTHEFSDILNLLQRKENDYRQILWIRGQAKKEQNQEPASPDEKISKGDKKSKKSQKGKEEEKEKDINYGPIEITQLAFGQKPQKVELSLKKKGQDVDIVEKGPLEQKDSNKVPVMGKKNKRGGKVMEQDTATFKKNNSSKDADVIAYLKNLKKDLITENVDDPNELVDKLGDYLEEIKTGRSDTFYSIRTYISDPKGLPFIHDFKNTIFLVVTKILSPKMNNNAKVDKKALEYGLSHVFEMRLLSSKQMSTIMDSTRDLYDMLNYHADDDIFDKMEEHYNDLGMDVPVNFGQPKKDEKVMKKGKNKIKISYDDDEGEDKDKDSEEEGGRKKISEEQKKKLIAKARAKEKWRESQEERERVDEETKYNLLVQLVKNKSRNETYEKQLEIDKNDSEEEKEDMKSNVMEECLICMENIREVVFLPCSHFVSCSLCSPRMDKCPLCYKGIEENLKIYWC